LVGMLGFKRWYDVPGAQITEAMGDELGSWLVWHKDIVREHIAANEKTIFDWKNIFFDQEHGCVRVAGYLPTDKDSVHQGKIAGTTLLWNMPWDFNDKSNVSKRLELLKENVTERVVNIFMHGHTGNVADVQAAAQKRQEYDLARGISSMQLSLGLMGADGTCLSSEVEEGETALVQVEEVLNNLEEKLPTFARQIGLVWGHSMQGNTVLSLAAKMGKALPFAEFDAVAPVILGSDAEKMVPENEKHVLLHAGWRGAMVKLMPVIHLIPRVSRRGVVKFANWTGVPAKVLGHYVRDTAMAAIHFGECVENPYYLKRVNKMLAMMPDLRNDKEMMERLARLAEEGRVWITIGGFDTILNPAQMKDYAIRAKLPLVELNSGHFPKQEEMEEAVGACKPELMRRFDRLAFAV